MPELDFKGKEFVRNHHLTVPFRPLIAEPGKSVGDGSLDDNLIIHGDNLHALKALLPKYAAKVDCIFIDPPYNTGNENWSYNDNVNSPMMREWLSSNPVNQEDMLRHDKWCSMMWPRFRLLRELLSERGSLWMTLDDNEVHHARLLLNEIFGEDSFVANVVWEKTTSARNDAEFFSSDHDHILVYSATPQSLILNRLQRTTSSNSAYSNPDNDERGPWREGDYKCAKSASERPNLFYAIEHPITGEEVWPRRDRVWAYGRPEMLRHVKEKRLWWGKTGNYTFPKLKRFKSEAPDDLVPRTLWHASDVDQTRTARTELQAIFNEDPFPTPKPVALVRRVLELATNDNSLVLDSFAGSGTTAHATLSLNWKDSGTRQFILVECEEYADTVTAERVRRVINGYPYQGNQSESLFEKKLTWTELKKGDHLRQEAENTKAMYAGSYDDVKIEVKDGTLRVVGMRNVKETAPGLGGSFTYCTLGDPIDLDKLLEGKGLPSRQALGEWLLYVATGKVGGKAKPPTKLDGLKEWHLASREDAHYWLIYRPNLKFLQSRDAALTLQLARKLKEADPHKKHFVFAPAKFVSNKMLRDENLPIEFAPIPFSLFRLERG